MCFYRVDWGTVHVPHCEKSGTARRHGLSAPVGVSMAEFDIGPVHCSFSLLLMCMMTGTVFCNVCKTSEALMERLDRWTTPLSILFFVLSGAELDMQILKNPVVLLIGIVYICGRTVSPDETVE